MTGHQNAGTLLTSFTANEFLLINHFHKLMVSIDLIKLFNFVVLDNIGVV